LKSFPDEAEILVRGGAGGAGCISFHRARFQPLGRPDGGNGGRGGDVILQAAPGAKTLSLFRRRRIFQAPSGQSGGSQDRHGRNGSQELIPVPLGTLVFDRETGLLLAELLTPGQQLTVAKGGRGGKGNAHFTSSRLRSPRFAQLGEEGQERRLRLELQILADVGLIGLPNAGKSTLLRSLTASKVRVDVFPFTTLSPQLGVVFQEGGEPVTLAEVPGLIPGAHKGKGLGHRFLRHVKRTRLLVQIIDLSDLNPADPLAPLKQLETEMGAFDPGLPFKPRLIALNKADLLGEDFPLPKVVAAYVQNNRRVFVISAATGAGVPELEQALLAELARL
jgi:GTP-binding protein